MQIYFSPKQGTATMCDAGCETRQSADSQGAGGSSGCRHDNDHRDGRVGNVATVSAGEPIGVGRVVDGAVE